jgi:predicted MFS family arabinose efflux permease
MNNVRLVFVGTGILYAVVVPVLAWMLPRETQARGKNGKKLQVGHAEMIPIFAVVLISFGFWASYAQFNSYFPLFANDWLGNRALSGVSFAIVAILVSLFSLGLSKFASKASRLSALAAATSIVFAFGWIGMVTRPVFLSVVLFLLTLSLGESVLSLYLAEKWATINKNRAGLMQSLNFASRNVAMGIGSFVGGRFYSASTSLRPWGFENVALLIFVVIGLCLGIRGRAK